ncbi:MAG: DUF58 domain-containing protein [Planctomycetota bacterium]
MSSLLARYLDPEVLNQVAQQPIDPQGLVIGNLAGAHKSPLSGFAVEFAGHREYVPGDEPKHVDWRVYFTRDKLFVKQYELETNYVCHLVLDVSASMRYGEGVQQKLLYAQRLVSTLAYSIVRQSDKVSLITFDDRLRASVPPSNSPSQVLRMTHRLDEVEPVEKTDVGPCLEAVAGRIGRREIVMVFSDILGDLDSLELALQRLRYSQHEVILFQIMHHDELAFEFDGMVRFIGLEIPEELLTQPQDLRRAYLAAVERFNTRFEEIALRNRCERVLLDTGLQLGETLADYLTQRLRQVRRR